MEVNKYASNGKANTGVALGGTALGIAGLDWLRNNGGNLLGGGCNNYSDIASVALGNMIANNGIGYRNGGCCSDDEFVTRYDARLQGELAAEKSKNALLEANIFTDKKIADVFERLSGKIDALENTVHANTCGQAVTNQQMADNIKFVDSKFDGVYRAIAEGDARERCYVESNFVHGKLVMPLDSICPPATPLCPEPAKK